MPRHRIAFVIVALLGAVLDFASKHWAFLYLRMGETVVVVERFFEIGKTTNPGIVFGLFPGARQVFLWVSVLAVPCIVAIFLSLKKPHWIMTASLALILGGTIGNAYDRIMFGEVRDFIKFYVPSPRTWTMTEWPLFNIADSCICVGVALLSLEMLFFDEKKKKKEAPPVVAAAGVPSGPTEPIPGIAPIPSGPTEPIPVSGVPSGPTEPVPKVEPPPPATP